MKTKIMTAVVGVLLFATGSAVAVPAPNSTVTIRDCEGVKELRLVDRSGNIVVGKRVERPPYVCQFLFDEPSR